MCSNVSVTTTATPSVSGNQNLSGLSEEVGSRLSLEDTRDVAGREEGEDTSDECETGTRTAPIPAQGAANPETGELELRWYRGVT